VVGQKELQMRDEVNGLVSGYLLDGKGGGKPVQWRDVRSWQPGQGQLWLHLDRTAEESRHWLSSDAGLDPIVVDALLAEETRPRCASIDTGMLVILRGVNLNPGAEPDDMLTIRLWIDGHRVVSMSGRRVMSISDLRDQIEAGRGPRRPAGLLVRLADRLIDRMSPVIEALGDEADALEEEILESADRQLRQRLREVRHTAISLHRYLAPQRDVLARLQIEKQPWLDRQHRMSLREISDQLIRYVEDLEEIRERAAVLQDELMSHISEQMSRNTYLLSVVAAIMLPLGLLTGLLGINVGGIPGADSSYGFLAVCGVLVIVVVLEVVVFRRLRWI
jgi:zinc transporter